MTIQVGQMNFNSQRVLVPTGEKSQKHKWARLVVMECLNCSARYMALTCDVHLRKCPHCQGGAKEAE